jgi:hypothetical protein
MRSVGRVVGWDLQPETCSLDTVLQPDRVQVGTDVQTVFMRY